MWDEGESYDLFLGKYFQSCFINTISGTKHVIHNDNKLLRITLIVFAKYWWVLTEVSKNSRRLRPYILCLPCTLLSWNADTTSQPVNRPEYVKHNIFSCKYNCMLEHLGLPLVLYILQTFSISLKAMHLLTPIRPK